MSQPVLAMIVLLPRRSSRINPGMGWPFAVSLGLQEKRRSAVLAAIPPIALGHAPSIE